MPTLPQLLEEDIRTIDTALDDFLSKSESSSAMILDKGGFVISQRGDVNTFDTTTLGALAAAAYAATQGIAGLVKEANFSNVYQQGENFSLLVSNIDEHCLLVVIFRAQISVGAVKYYAVNTIGAVGRQLQVAHSRAPGEGIDLSALNVVDTADMFFRKSDEPVAEVPEAALDPMPGAMSTTSDDPLVKLQKMKQLLASGLITQEDFDRKKKQILEQM